MGYEDIVCCHLAVDRTHFLSIMSMKGPKNSIKCEDFLDQVREYYLFEDIRIYIHTHAYIYSYVM